MKRKVKRLRYNIRKIVEYAKQKGVEPINLTEEELEQFEVRKEKFGIETCYPMNRKDKCYVCDKRTGWLDKVHTVYLCSEDCMNIVDKKYNDGEDIVVNEEGAKILEQVERDLFE